MCVSLGFTVRCYWVGICFGRSLGWCLQNRVFTVTWLAGAFMLGLCYFASIPQYAIYGCLGAQASIGIHSQFVRSHRGSRARMNEPQALCIVPAIRYFTSSPTRGLDQNQTHRTSLSHRHRHPDPINRFGVRMVCYLPHSDYTDTDRKTTNWERPAWRTPSTGSNGVQATDTAMAHTRRGSNSSSTRSQTPFTELPSKYSRCHSANPAMDTPCVAPGASATTAGAVVVDVPLPPVR